MINIIGGTYREIDFDENSIEIFGSGFRATKYLLENKCKTRFHTLGNHEVETILTENQKVYSDFTYECTEHQSLITFKYSFSLDQPEIFPNVQNLKKEIILEVNSEKIIAFGMLESKMKITGSKVVYDPQGTINPQKFSEFGIADELIYIVNQNEAFTICSSNNIDEIKNFFFNYENAKAFIIKNGPFGATLYLRDEECIIPSYITNNVYKIGSGDIFTASFGYFWMKNGLSIQECAHYASKATALYCDKKAYCDTSKIDNFEFKEFQNHNLKEKQVYIASPFFSLSELILVDKIRSAFLSFGIKVFSPYHDIGIGHDNTIAEKDLIGIDNSDIIFCVLDNYDSGTLIESGYSMAKRKKIIGYHRSSFDNELFMLKPADLDIYPHLTTAIYQTIWEL